MHRDAHLRTPRLLLRIHLDLDVRDGVLKHEIKELFSCHAYKADWPTDQWRRKPHSTALGMGMRAVGAADKHQNGISGKRGIS